MTDYNAILDTQCDPDAPLTSFLAYAWRDNPIAISEGSTDAPVMAVGWHPYDMVTVGDGSTGKFYDFAVDGSNALIETPDFVDGYEYAIRFDAFVPVSGAVNVQAFAAASSSWVTASSFTSNSSAYDGLAAFYFPRLDAYSHAGQWLVPLSSGTPLTTGAFSFSSGSSTKISKARVQTTSGTTTGGTLHLLRRREYITG